MTLTDATIERAMHAFLTTIVGVLAARVGVSGVYSTAEPSSYPPGCERRRSARDRIRSVPGHERIGKGKATVWSVSAAAYRAHHARRVEPPTPSAKTDQELADAALAASGLRPTRQRRDRASA